MTTVHRLASQLCEHGALELTEQKTYRVGPWLWEIGTLSAHTRTFRYVALPFMQDLYEATHENVQLAVPDGFDALVVERVRGRTSVRITSRVGGRLPLHSTGVGKAILAFSSREFQEAVMARGLAPMTPYTITDPEILRRELAETRERGYSITRMEMGLNSASVGVPILDADDDRPGCHLAHRGGLAGRRGPPGTAHQGRGPRHQPPARGARTLRGRPIAARRRRGWLNGTSSSTEWTAPLTRPCTAPIGCLDPAKAMEERDDLSPESSGPTVIEPRTSPTAGWSIRRVAMADWSSAVLALIVVVAVIGIAHPNFLAPGQLINVVQSSVYAAIIAAGIVFLIPQNEIDLSVGGNFILTGIVVAVLMREGFNPWIAVAITLVVATADRGRQRLHQPGHRHPVAHRHAGHGLDAARPGPGALQRHAGDRTAAVRPLLRDPGRRQGRWASRSRSGCWRLIVVVLTIVMRQTPFGFRVREIGSNPDAAEFSGIPIRRTKTMGFMLAALMAGIAGVVGVAFFTSGDPQSGGGIELYAVAGAVIGGTPLAGGKATVFGAVMGAILLTAVSVGLVYFQIPAAWSQFATGAVILGAVSIDGLVQRQRRRAAQQG